MCDVDSLVPVTNNLGRLVGDGDKFVRQTARYGGVVKVKWDEECLVCRESESKVNRIGILPRKPG